MTAYAVPAIYAENGVLDLGKFTSAEQPPYAEIGTRLLSARYELHLTQPEIALAIGVSERAYQHYERGARLIPTEALMRLRLLFGVSADRILFGPPEPGQEHPPVAGVASAAPSGEASPLAGDVAPYARATLAGLPPDARASLLHHLLQIDHAERTGAGRVNRPQRTARARRFKADLSAPKYQNPDNPQQTWRGRGMKPTWLRDALASGRPLSDFDTERGSEQSPGGGD